MKRALIRSNIFNLFFYIATGVACIVCLPTLLLPRKYFMGVVYGFVHTVYAFERFILGLDYEIRGQEHLPKDGSYIVAAKHQSPYETMKLHILFKDPAIILKKELFRIPLWGMYLKKSDVIAIDRSSREQASKSIKDGAQRMMAQGRPIIIFPQGTRVNPDQTIADKPYKMGVAKMQETTGLPIIPMALNAGMFWPRSGWLKSPGRVVFKFLEPIEAGKERTAVMAKIEKDVEEETLSLQNEAREAALERRNGIFNTILGLLLIGGIAAGVYTYFWFETAKYIKQQYPIALQDLVDSEYKISTPIVSGYPGKVTLSIPYERLSTDEGTVQIEALQARGWPIPGLPIDITTGKILVENFKWSAPLEFDSLEAKVLMSDNVLNIQESLLTRDTFTASIVGTADLKQEPLPLLNLGLTLNHHERLLQELVANKAIETRIALFIGAGFSALANPDGIVEVPIVQRENVIYAGPIPVLSLPATRALPVSGSRNVLVPSEQFSDE